MLKELNLEQQRQTLLEEKKHLEEELQNANTVIKCQSKKNEIQERIREINEELLGVYVEMERGEDEGEKQKTQPNE